MRWSAGAPSRRPWHPAGTLLALYQHDPAQPLGRTGNGTLRLNQDARGLAFEVDVPETQLGNDVLTLARRGDLAGASFAFRVPPGGDHWPTRGDRELRQVELVEVSAVTVPAYQATTISARAMARALGHAEADARLRRLLLEVL